MEPKRERLRERSWQLWQKRIERLFRRQIEYGLCWYDLAWEMVSRISDPESGVRSQEKKSPKMSTSVDRVEMRSRVPAWWQVILPREGKGSGKKRIHSFTRSFDKICLYSDGASRFIGPGLIMAHVSFTAATGKHLKCTRHTREWTCGQELGQWNWLPVWSFVRQRLSLMRWLTSDARVICCITYSAQ